MTIATLKKYRTVSYDAHGKPIGVQLDLRNKELRNFYEVMMEDLMAVKEAMKNDDGTRYEIKFEENGVRKEFTLKNAK